MTDNSNVTTRPQQSANGSTLIEFPGVNRRPAWRKELSERFREIQQKRAREADPEGETISHRPDREQPFSAPAEARTSARAAEPTPKQQPTSKQLGLVPPADEPALNPLVAAALRRIERARANATAQPMARQGSGRAQAATAAARVVDEQTEEVVEAVATPQPPPLVVVQPKQVAKAEQQQQQSAAEPAAAEVKVEEPTLPERAPATRAVATEKPETAEGVRRQEVRGQEVATASAQQTAEAEADALGGGRQPRHISGVLDEFWLERQGIELLPKVAEKELTYDDRAPRTRRFGAAAVDLLAVGLLSAPFAVAIELTIGNWGDPRVSSSMALIVALVMFLYQTCSVALAGRTLGMSLCALQAVDARKANVPTTGQCMRRAVVYILSLATCGIGILYSLFDAEGRTAHDILSGTVVVRK